VISHIKYVISPKYSKHIINMLSNDNKRGHIHMSKVKSSQDQFDRIIREEECRRLTGICRTTRYMMERKGVFPARRQLGARSVGWLLSEVNDWLDRQPKAQLKSA